jgi:hypothetical protein
MSEMTINGVENLLGEALGWSGLKCKVNALYRQIDRSMVAVAHIPGRGQGLVKLTQIISDAFCGDVELKDLEREGIEYKAVFILSSEALTGADEAG